MRKTIPSGKNVYQKRKICRFCADQNLPISHKDYPALRYFVTERGKIIPRRISGTCARHQRKLTRAIKKARVLCILPFSASSV